LGGISPLYFSPFEHSNPYSTNMSRYHWQLPPSIPISENPDDVPVILEQPLEVPCQWCGYYFCSLYCYRRILVAYHDTWMPVAYWHHQHQYHWQDPSWGPGPSRMGYREAGTLYPSYQTTHESSETISTDGYTGHNLGYAWINAHNETGGGMVSAA
jgi:hypothetical protein